jgi:hypothetical protein
VTDRIHEVKEIQVIHTPHRVNQMLEQGWILLTAHSRNDDGLNQLEFCLGRITADILLSSSGI